MSLLANLIGSSLLISSTASIIFVYQCRARLVERLRVLTAEALRLEQNFYLSLGKFVS